MEEFFLFSDLMGGNRTQVCSVVETGTRNRFIGQVFHHDAPPR